MPWTFPVTVTACERTVSYSYWIVQWNFRKRLAW